jgi:hypothetical protein
MREVTLNKCGYGMNEALRIYAVDEPGAGGANHEYEVMLAMPNQDPETLQLLSGEQILPVLQSIYFQNGPVQEAGPNGIGQEELLAIVADRLQSFQKGPFASKYNEEALTHVELALSWLKQRTLDRAARGVEGQSKV